MVHWERFCLFEQEDSRVFLQFILDAVHDETLVNITGHKVT